MADEPEPQPVAPAQPAPWPNPRPAVIASTLEWAARMWLIDGDAANAREFAVLAEEAFGRMVNETQP